jgi:hypothetical protein
MSRAGRSYQSRRRVGRVQRRRQQRTEHQAERFQDEPTYVQQPADHSMRVAADEAKKRRKEENW